MKRQIVPDVISGEQELLCVNPGETASRAAAAMSKRHVAAALVLEDNKLVGILTERDLVFRVMAKEIDANAIAVRDIMTADPKTIGPNEQASAALEMMREGHFRHLPVTDGNAILGMISIRDLYEAMASGLAEDLQNAETLIYGEQYGGLSA